MKVDSLSKFTEASAVKLCAYFEMQHMSPPSDETTSCRDFLSTMLQQKDFADAIHFMACGLPKRESIWWSCVCTRVLCSDTLSAKEQSALEAVETWVKRPNEDYRYATEFLNEDLKYQSPVGWSAQAVFWSGDNIVARDKPKVAPSDYLFANAVHGAIQLAVVQQPKQLEQRYKECIKRGIDIANGGNGQVQVAREMS